jgi:ankyrin repeat protein
MRALLALSAVYLLFLGLVGCSKEEKISALDSELVMQCGEPDATSKDVEALLDKGANVNAQLYEGASALSLACSTLNEDVVRTLIQRGANVNVTDDLGYTPLHEIARYGDGVLKEQQGIVAAITNLLIEHGANVNAKNDEGQTPLALVRYNHELAALLKSHGGM